MNKSLIIFSTLLLAGCQTHYEWQSAPGKEASLKSDLSSCEKATKGKEDVVTYNGVQKSTPLEDCMRPKGHEYVEVIWNGYPADRYIQDSVDTLTIMNAF